MARPKGLVPSSTRVAPHALPRPVIYCLARAARPTVALRPRACRRPCPPHPHPCSTYMESFVDPSKTHERLTPYHWNAPRSRLDYVKSDVIPHRRYCKPRNQMSYE